jgi:hypothetical protein
MEVVRALFKGKDAYGVWRIGNLLIDSDNNNRHAIHPTGDFRSHIVDSVTVGQCTGMRDKNNNLVYEGDKIQFSFEDGDSEGGIVKWNKGRWVVLFSKSIEDSFDTFEESRFEIVGNIHDASQCSDCPIFECPVSPGDIGDIGDECRGACESGMTFFEYAAEVAKDRDFWQGRTYAIEDLMKTSLSCCGCTSSEGSVRNCSECNKCGKYVLNEALLPEPFRFPMAGEGGI